jgi:hypothetical protein
MKFLHKTTACTFIIIALILVILMFFSCSATEKPNRFYELLKLVPAQISNEETTMILVDYASYWEDNDISLITADNRPITYEEYLDIIQDDEVGIRLYRCDIIGHALFDPNNGANLEKYLGYNFTDVDAAIEFGMPPSILTAAIGRFDASDTESALSHQDDWPSWAKEAYFVEKYSGVTIHSWGNGFEIHIDTRLMPPHIDQLGRARPLAVTDKYLFYAPSVSAIQAMINSSQGKQDNLADLPEYASIANGLSDLHVYQAIVGDESWVNGDLEYTVTYTGPRLKKFVSFGVGFGRDEKGNFTAVVLYHESADDAEANVSLLKELIENTNSTAVDKPWNEIITDTSIYVEDNVLLAKLYSNSLSLWTMVYTHDTLLLHEQE